MRLLGDRVLVRFCTPEPHPSGLFVPEDKSCRKAKVIQVGPGRVTKKGALVPAPVVPGDIVLVAYGWNKTKQAQIVSEVLEDREVVILKPEDLMGVVDETEEG